MLRAWCYTGRANDNIRPGRSAFLSEPLLVDADPTPNPEAYKFTVNRELNAGPGRTFDGPADAAGFPLTQRLFQVPGVRTLFFLNDFITVGRMPGRLGRHPCRCGGGDTVFL